jgi:pilus assembly protein CpaD
MRSIRSLAVIATVLLAPLAACDSPERAVHIAPKQPRADRATAMHGVSFTPARADVSASERQRLAAFVQDLQLDRTSVTLLTSPDMPALQAQRAASVRHQLHRLGVSTASVGSARSVIVGPNSVVVSAESYSARALNCPDWSKPSTYDPYNLPMSNLGCANASNLADMVASPRDLEVGRTPGGPASGHLGAAAVDRLYNDKAKVPGVSGASGGGGAGAGTGGSGTGGTGGTSTN